MSGKSSPWIFLLGLMHLLSSADFENASEKAKILPVDDIDNIAFVFYESPTAFVSARFDQTGSVFSDPKYKINLPNVLYIPGYLDSKDTATTQEVVNGYFQKGGYNVFVLDWAYLASGTYASAVENANRVGTKLGEAYILIANGGVPEENHLIVGHDIGAHLAGQAGRTLIAKTNGAISIHRITGLDPDKRLYYPPVPGIHHLNRNDAKFVDIIHTDSGGYGTARVTGTVDFYVNTGRRFQPGCPVGVFLIRSDNDLCSHRRAIHLWVESLTTPSSKFTSTLFINPTIATSMGVNCPITATPGIYKVFTNAASPYSRS